MASYQRPTVHDSWGACQEMELLCTRYAEKRQEDNRYLDFSWGVQNYFGDLQSISWLILSIGVQMQSSHVG